MFNDNWMRERGFIEEELKTAADIIKNHSNKPLIVAQTEELISHAIERMKTFKISQIPVKNLNGFVGSIDESLLLHHFINDKNIANKPIKEIMGEPYPVIKMSTKLEDISSLITKENDAVLVELENGNHHIITKYDIISAI